MAKNKKNPEVISQHPRQQSANRNNSANLNLKKRQRSKSDETNPTRDCLRVAAASSSSVSARNAKSQRIKETGHLDIVPHVVQWLESRKMSIPATLKQDCFTSSVDGILTLLPGLRERERRALIRRLEKVIRNNGVGDAKPNNELGDSDDEYSESHENRQKNDIQTEYWPPFVEFSNNYRWDSSVPPEIKKQYHPPNGARNRPSFFSRKVYFKKITDNNHPAYGEYGLYCALPNGAPPGTWLLDYVGHITLGEHQDKKSDYVSDFGEKSELACDANSYGNEARFLNDFRNTGKHPNVEFNLRRDKHGELRQGVYVKLKKNSKVEGFEGVKQHEELLVSYGKSYWRSRHGNLTDFVRRLPGQEASREKFVRNGMIRQDLVQSHENST